MTTVGELWCGLTRNEQGRITAAIDNAVPGMGTPFLMAILRSARSSIIVQSKADPADPYPHLFRATPTPPEPVKCHDCDTEVVVAPLPWVIDGERIVYLGSSCWRKRILRTDEERSARNVALTLPIDEPGETS